MRCYVDMLLITSTANIKTWERDNGLYGGLSPLARGTWALPEWGLFCTRFIPAAAGNSQGVEKWLILIWVYPRWRGELKLFLIQCGRSDGLSPLARGTRYITRLCSYLKRFIPAGAGNSCCRRTRRALPPVYPRWRGELAATKRCNAFSNGLSPLARGTQLWYGLDPFRVRFIPAGAGNSVGINAGAVPTTVYPRWRGELRNVWARGLERAGLSPLARGTPASPADVVNRRRFIPAGAGNSYRLIVNVPLLAVYPRWRGELSSMKNRRNVLLGLSPLARGTL